MVKGDRHPVGFVGSPLGAPGNPGVSARPDHGQSTRGGRSCSRLGAIPRVRDQGSALPGAGQEGALLRPACLRLCPAAASAAGVWQLFRGNLSFLKDAQDDCCREKAQWRRAYANAFKQRISLGLKDAEQNVIPDSRPRTTLPALPFTTAPIKLYYLSCFLLSSLPH